ncbi:hypothetical protein B0H21DRAFT_811643 [Amylocystis lapponica]|nr:hypothetical protein B0H21DRAFT_811643 [Amylocystis lapponica]
MARRTLTPATPIPTAVSTAPPRDPSLLAQSDPVWSANLLLLRRQWKWAAFSQFFYTFATLLATGDVALSEIEDDLARSTALYLPRMMHRLLYTLTQDRKITIDNWQTALRKQYMRRDPTRNPIGPEPKLPSRESSPDPSTPGAEPDGEEGETAGPGEPSTAIPVNGTTNGESRAGTDVLDESHIPIKGEVEHSTQLVEDEDLAELEEESKDWLELPMLDKLDSLHLLTEWQFQNSQRLRTMMKDDDEGAQWRIEPIGYDAKTNAYWLIGPDRLWIQRVPPKPPKGTKRKRTTAPSKSKAKASTSKLERDDEESDSQQQSAKRKRVQPKVTGRSTRSHKKQAAPITPEAGGKSARAAKLQANRKLDAQAKELAEFQAASMSKSGSRSTRRTRSELEPRSSPPKLLPQTPRGTRTSARLRGPAAKEDDEWQQIPEEWLIESADVAEPIDVKGKGKAKAAKEEIEEHGPAMEEHKTGLESDEESSELSDLPEDVDESGETESTNQHLPSSSLFPNGNSHKARSSKRLTPKIQSQAANEPSDVPDVTGDPMLGDVHPVPEDFVEWEAICVTLYEWEHIAERFEKATHYLEKALFKVLSQHIVPAVTAELKESERKRRIEEAVVHRKRSSRIAVKESEKEEARLAAKKKAEESEKLARAKRAEARMKKEEAEREKRERAREQRRIEREEREQRALTKHKRADEESVSVDIDDRESTATPVVNGTHSSNSVHLSRVATPSVQSPDWILECEICGASGINIDDGQPMVSCGLCSKWQHIKCHDLADVRQGRPNRNWDTQQFYCKRCRVRATADGPSYAVPQQQPYIAAQQYSYSQPSSSTSMPHQQNLATTNPHDLYSQSTSDVRFLSRQPVENGSSYGQPQYSQKNFAPSPAHARTQASNGALTFAHYQPEQRGFSTRTSQQQPAQPAWGNGYHSADNLAQRLPPSSQYAPQYSHSGGTYASNGIPNGGTPVAYQQQNLPASHLPTYSHSQDHGMPSNAGWGSTANGYASNVGTSATQSAAESLAYMHELANGRHGGWQHPHASSPHVQSNGGGLEHGHGYPSTYAEQHQRGAAPSYHYPSAT